MSYKAAHANERGDRRTVTNGFAGSVSEEPFRKFRFARDCFQKTLSSICRIILQKTIHPWARTKIEQKRVFARYNKTAPILSPNVCN